MPSLNRYEKVTFENCGTQTTKPSLAKPSLDRYRNGEWKTQNLQLCHVLFRHVFAQR